MVQAAPVLAGGDTPVPFEGLDHGVGVGKAAFLRKLRQGSLSRQQAGRIGKTQQFQIAGKGNAQITGKAAGKIGLAQESVLRQLVQGDPFPVMGLDVLGDIFQRLLNAAALHRLAVIQKVPAQVLYNGGGAAFGIGDPGLFLFIQRLKGPGQVPPQHVKGRLLFFHGKERTAADLVFQQFGSNTPDKSRCDRKR